MTIRDNQSDRLISIFASGYAPFSVDITYEHSEVEESGYFIFSLNLETAKKIIEIQAQQKTITIHFPPYLDRQIIRDLLHLSGLVFLSYDKTNSTYLASSSISLDGDTMQQISKKCLENNDYKSILEAHFWLVKQTTNSFSKKIKNRVELFNLLLSALSLFASTGVSFFNTSQVKALNCLLGLISFIILIKIIINFDVLSYKNISRLSLIQLRSLIPTIETLKKTNLRTILSKTRIILNKTFNTIRIILNEIRIEINQPELSPAIFIVGSIMPFTVTESVNNNVLTFIVLAFIGCIMFIKRQHFWLQFKQQLEQFPLYAKLSSFLTKFDVTIFLLEIAIAAFLIGSLIQVGSINHFINKINIWLNNLNPEHLLLIVPIVGILLIPINLLNIQMPSFFEGFERWLKKSTNPIILKIIGYILLLIVIIVEGFLLGHSLSGFLHYDSLILIQLIILTLMIMRLPQHFLTFLTKFFWENLLSSLQ